MNKQRFEHEMRKARTLATSQDQDYWAGYRQGLRHNYHGIKFGTEDEHQYWLAFDGDEIRQQRLAGYRAGLAVQ